MAAWIPIATGIIAAVIYKIIGIAERKGAVEGAIKALEELYNAFTFDAVISNILDPDTAAKIIKLKREDKALQRLERFVNFLKWINWEFAKTSVIVGAISPSGGYAVTHLLNALSWSFGFGWLSWMGLSPVLRSTISDPAEQALMEEFRPRLITRAFTLSLLRSGLITKEQAKDILKKLGYSDEIIDVMIKSVTIEKTEKDKDLTKTDILRAYRRGIITEEEARKHLEELGYSPEEIDILLKLYKPAKEVTKKERTKDLTTGAILRAFRYGIIDRDEAITRLQEIKYDKEEAELLVRTEEARKRSRVHVRNRDLTLSMLRKALELGILTEAEVLEYLKQLGYSDEEAKIILEIWLTRLKLEEEEKKK